MSNEQSILPSTSVSIHNKLFVPVYKWGIYFSGDAQDREALSVNEFLERVEEYRVARGVSEEELIISLCDLLKGSARLWNSSLKAKIRTWSQFVQLLKEEFLDADYDYELKMAIREHYHCRDGTERVGSYFACMLNLFNRLRNPLLEEEKLCILRRTIDPYYIHRLGLEEIHKVDDLLAACKKLEVARNLANQSNRLSNDLVSRLEPDLAPPSSSRRHSSISSGPPRRDHNIKSVNSIACWNCQKLGHSFTNCGKPREAKFCFRCGKANVIKYTCTCFRGNGARGRQNTGRRSTPENRLEKNNTRVRVANRDDCDVLGLVSLPIELYGRVKVIRALVVLDIAVDIILGIDFWKDMNIIPDFSNHSWHFGNLPAELMGLTGNKVSGLYLINVEERSRLDRLVFDFFNKMGTTLGCAKGVFHTIDTGDSRPIKQRYYPVFPYIQEKLIWR
ncbi:hypothetical protein NQ314_013180 [Rhamnusium bicolor]|uniref:CCHC-type domain-containing protein n=1 Tax=Rhamnusium bicolor TaxID=1586634 RepID=A0AAV8X870_9CUCU|nr:hypothetical protein NQ314_013180 [Rhamnusium bicolor]